MENSCYRCNAPVAMGVPFCPSCGAPQIRVTTAASNQDAQVVLRSEDESEPLRYSSEFAPPILVRPATIKWSSALPRVAVSAVATVALLQLFGALTGLPALGFLALPAGGILAVYLYSRREPGLVTPGMGARLGAVAGFLVSAIYLLIGLVDIAIDRQKLMEMVQKTMQEAASKNPSPQTDVLLRQLNTPEGTTALIVIAAVVFLFVSLILCTAGGSVGAVVMRRQRQNRN